MLFDMQARAVPGISAQVKYSMRTTSDGGAEFDADEILACAERAIDDVLAQAGTCSVIAVASDSLVSNILGVDGDGRAVTPVFTYADTRNARQVAELARAPRRTHDTSARRHIVSFELFAGAIFVARARRFATRKILDVARRISLVSLDGTTRMQLFGCLVDGFAQSTKIRLG